MGRPDPTAVILDSGAVTEPFPNGSVSAAWGDETQTGTWITTPTARDIAAAAEVLNAAERPVIVPGSGIHASGAYDELTAVTEAYEAAVVTFYLGKSTFPETHRLAGGIIGSFGHKGASRLVNGADTLLVVGCCMNPMDTSWQVPDFICPNERTIIHADVGPRNVGRVYPADVGPTDDASGSSRELAAASGTDDGWAEDRAREARKSFYTSECGSDAAPILPQRVVKEIEYIVDEDTVTTVDSGNSRFWLLNYLQMSAMQMHYGSGGVGDMGWATLTVVSAALATDKHIIGVAGDSGFTMTMTNVKTTVEHGIASTLVILDDTSLGMVRQMQHVPDGIAGVEFHDTDFTRVVEVFDATGVRVETSGELGDALVDAETHGLPAVIDTRIGRSQDMAAALQSPFYTSVGGPHE